jgi:hypothetical protein
MSRTTAVAITGAGAPVHKASAALYATGGIFTNSR